MRTVVAEHTAQIHQGAGDIDALPLAAGQHHAFKDRQHLAVGLLTFGKLALIPLRNTKVGQQPGAVALKLPMRWVFKHPQRTV